MSELSREEDVGASESELETGDTISLLNEDIGRNITKEQCLGADYNIALFNANLRLSKQKNNETFNELVVRNASSGAERLQAENMVLSLDTIKQQLKGKEQLGERVAQIPTLALTTLIRMDARKRRLTAHINEDPVSGDENADLTRFLVQELVQDAMDHLFFIEKQAIFFGVIKQKQKKADTATIENDERELSASYASYSLDSEKLSTSKLISELHAIDVNSTPDDCCRYIEEALRGCLEEFLKREIDEHMRGSSTKIGQPKEKQGEQLEQLKSKLGLAKEDARKFRRTLSTWVLVSENLRKELTTRMAQLKEDIQNVQRVVERELVDDAELMQLAAHARTALQARYATDGEKQEKIVREKKAEEVRTQQAEEQKERRTFLVMSSIGLGVLVGLFLGGIVGLIAGITKLAGVSDVFNAVKAIGELFGLVGDPAAFVGIAAIAVAVIIVCLIVGAIVGSVVKDDVQNQEIEVSDNENELEQTEELDAEKSSDVPNEQKETAEVVKSQIQDTTHSSHEELFLGEEQVPTAVMNLVLAQPVSQSTRTSIDDTDDGQQSVTQSTASVPVHTPPPTGVGAPEQEPAPPVEDTLHL